MSPEYQLVVDADRLVAVYVVRLKEWAKAKCESTLRYSKLRPVSPGNIAFSESLRIWEALANDDREYQDLKVVEKNFASDVLELLPQLISTYKRFGLDPKGIAYRIKRGDTEHLLQYSVDNPCVRFDPMEDDIQIFHLCGHISALKNVCVNIRQGNLNHSSPDDVLSAIEEFQTLNKTGWHPNKFDRLVKGNGDLAPLCVALIKRLKHLVAAIYGAAQRWGIEENELACLSNYLVKGSYSLCDSTILEQVKARAEIEQQIGRTICPTQANPNEASIEAPEVYYTLLSFIPALLPLMHSKNAVCKVSEYAVAEAIGEHCKHQAALAVPDDECFPFVESAGELGPAISFQADIALAHFDLLSEIMDDHPAGPYVLWMYQTAQRFMKANGYSNLAVSDEAKQEAIKRLNAKIEAEESKGPQHSQTTTGEGNDGPHPPNLFRWGGKTVELPPIPWKLLKAIWDAVGKRMLTNDAGMAVWEDDEYSRDAMNAAKKRVNQSITDAGCPLSLREKNGYLALI